MPPNGRGREDSGLRSVQKGGTVTVVQLLTLGNQLIIGKAADIHVNQQGFKLVEQSIL